MNKNSFITLLQRFNNTSASEAEEILLLEKEYPYSQVIHTLAARATKDHGLKNHDRHLRVAAVYASDRAVLKEIITAEKAPLVEPTTETLSEDKSTPQQTDDFSAGSKTPVQISAASAASSEGLSATKSEETDIARLQPQGLSSSFIEIDSVDIADEVMHDLEKLNALKQNFEMLLVEYSEVVSAKQSAKDIKPSARKEDAHEESKSAEVEKENLTPKEKAKNRRARIIELAKSMGASEVEEIDEKPSKKKGGKGGQKGQPDELIEEIRVTKLEIIPENDKQKEQIHLIDQFILAQPSITSGKDRQPATVADLNPIKSGEFGDNIISETLVEILIKQGKKDKAIEVLKKLIWKYPQKKAYFASQIEDLKK